MFEFIAGLVVAGFIGFLKLRRKEAEFRGTLIAIHNGKAEPDENGYVSWCVGV